MGINPIDSADSYGPEVSENLIAEALHPYPDGLVIDQGRAAAQRPGRLAVRLHPPLCALGLKRELVICRYEEIVTAR